LSIGGVSSQATATSGSIVADGAGSVETGDAEATAIGTAEGAGTERVLVVESAASAETTPGPTGTPSTGNSNGSNAARTTAPTK
jgi:hypothetical protein